MAATYLFYRWNWNEAEKESRKAIEPYPNFAEAYHLYAYVLLAMNRNDEAVAAQRTSQELDPFARPWALGYVLDCAGRYEQASSEFHQRIEALPRGGMRVRVLDLGINKESLPIFGYVRAPLLRRVCMRRTGNRRKRFIVDENARTDPSVSKAVGENRSVMSVPIALETLIWIVLFF